MSQFIDMITLIYRSLKTYKRIKKLMNIQSKLLKEMNISMDSHKQDKDLLVGTHLFQSTNLISQYIEVLEKNINIMENKMKDMLKQ